MLKQWVNSNKIIPTITAGVIIGSLVVFIEISFAALIFSGELSQFISQGVGLLLVGAMVMGVVTAMTSSLSTVISTPQDSPVAILGVIAAGILLAMPSTATGDQTYFTVVAAIMLSTFLTALFFLVLSKYKLGSLVRFIPYPVFGGFLAGTGWLLVVGSFDIMIDLSQNSNLFASLLQPESLIKWIPGVFLAFALLYSIRRTGKAQNIFVMLIAGFALFYLGLFASGISLEEANKAGWLLGSFSGDSLWRPLTIANLNMVNWPAIASQMGNMGAILLISLIALLLNASGLELIYNQHVDLNKELRSSGIANIAAGLVGSPPGFHAISLSAMGYRIAGTRWVGLVFSLVIGSVFIFGASFLSYFPKFVVGGIILYIGLDFLVEWLYDTRNKLPRAEYFLVIAIVVVVGTFGFLWGVFVGIFMAVILFVVNYSQIDVIKHTFSGSTYQSNVDRAVHHSRIINEHGEELYIIKLQGFVFFGTATHIYTNIAERVAAADLPNLRLVVLDFRLVNRLDSSALNSFTKLIQLAERKEFSIIFTDLSEDLEKLFLTSDFGKHHNKLFRIFPDLDHGVEWCEDVLLNASGATLAQVHRSLPDLLERAFPGEMDYSVLVEYMEKRQVSAGDYLIKQETKNEYVFFVEIGRVTAQVDDAEAGLVRLRSMGPGTMIGELSFYLNLPTSASVVTDTDTTVYQLSKNDLRKMEEEIPHAAAGFHKLVTLLMGERLLNTTRTLRALLD
ncbi:MAG: SulP family inorganic anion transporter [Chloroflexota bacterium]